MPSAFLRPTATIRRTLHLIHIAHSIHILISLLCLFYVLQHQVCSEADFTRFSGTAVERDFVEAPSQMLENWCWEREAIIRMSGRISDNKPLPEELLKSLLKGRNANAGILNKRQVFLATFDQTIHTSKKVSYLLL